MRGWVCRLQLLLALASAVILRSESRGTHDHILLSQIRNSPRPGPSGTGWTSYTPRHWVMHSDWICVSCYITSGRIDSENTFQSRIHGNVCLSPSHGLFPRICLHGNVFTEPLPSNGSMRHSIFLLCWNKINHIKFQVFINIVFRTVYASRGNTENKVHIIT
jgi:hypothetical protein